MEMVQQKTYEDRIKDAALLLRDYLASRVSAQVVANDIGGAKALVDQPGWKFLGDIIGDLEETAPLTKETTDD